MGVKRKERKKYREIFDYYRDCDRINKVGYIGKRIRDLTRKRTRYIYSDV